MASGQIVAVLNSLKPTQTDAARGTSLVDTSSPVGHHHAFLFTGGGSTVEYLDAGGVIDPISYAGNGLRLSLWVAANTTANATVLQAAWRRQNTAEAVNASHSFSYQPVTITWAGTAFFPQNVFIDFTSAQIDSLVAGDPFDLRIKRDANHASDTYTGDCYLLWDYVTILEKSA